jgi:hypothetical protein
MSTNMPILYLLPIALVAACVYLWRHWRRPAALSLLAPAGCAVAAVFELVDMDHSSNWSGYDALFRYAGCVIAGYLALGLVVFVRAAARARRPNPNNS